MENVIAAFTEVGVATIEVIESQSVAELTNDEVPIFASFRHIFSGAQSYNYVILGTASVESRQALIVLINKIVAEVEPDQRGVLYAVPLAFAFDFGAPT